MSEPTQTTSDDYELEHFKKFLQAKNINLKCEVCGNEDFGFSGRNENNSLAPALYYQKPAFPLSNHSAGVECVAATCLNCGNVKLFNRNVVDTSMRGQKDNG